MKVHQGLGAKVRRDRGACVKGKIALVGMSRGWKVRVGDETSGRRNTFGRCE